MNKSDFEKLFLLATKYPWLVERRESLEGILFNDCKEEEHRSLILKLIDNFIYISAEQFQQEIDLLALAIVSSPCFDISEPSKSIICAMANDSSPDSSQAVINFIKIRFQELNITGFEFSNSISDIYKIQKREGFKRNKVIVIDDFLGSGKTAMSKFGFFRGLVYPESFEIDLCFAFMFGSSVGVRFLKENSVKFEVVNVIKRGISDQCNKELIAQELALMEELEINLAENYGTHLLQDCSFGYGKTEALFAIEKASIPNSVFPIFWWGKYRNNINRPVLFSRYVGE